MLEEDYHHKLRLLLDHLQSGVEIPSSWRDFFDRQGAVPSTPDDRRQFARRYVREEAVCEMRQTLPVFPRRHEYSKVYLKDISRGGVAFLMGKQLFPGEQLLLWTGEGKLSCAVVRCRKHHDRCYEIGARIR